MRVRNREYGLIFRADHLECLNCNQLREDISNLQKQLRELMDERNELMDTLWDYQEADPD